MESENLNFERDYSGLPSLISKGEKSGCILSMLHLPLKVDREVTNDQISPTQYIPFSVQNASTSAGAF